MDKEQNFYIDWSHHKEKFTFCCWLWLKCLITTSIVYQLLLMYNCRLFYSLSHATHAFILMYLIWNGSFNYYYFHYQIQIYSFSWFLFTVQPIMACNLNKRRSKREDGDGEDEVDIRRSNTETSRYCTEKRLCGSARAVRATHIPLCITAYRDKLTCFLVKKKKCTWLLSNVVPSI